MEIKFNNLTLQYNAIKNNIIPRINQLFESSSYILGKDVKIFETNFAKYIGCKYCVGVSSGTDAITLAVTALLNNKDTLFIPLLLIIHSHFFIESSFACCLVSLITKICLK